MGSAISGNIRDAGSFYWLAGPSCVSGRASGPGYPIPRTPVRGHKGGGDWTLWADIPIKHPMSLRERTRPGLGSVDKRACGN